MVFVPDLGATLCKMKNKTKNNLQRMGASYTEVPSDSQSHAKEHLMPLLHTSKTLQQIFL